MVFSKCGFKDLAVLVVLEVVNKRSAHDGSALQILDSPLDVIFADQAIFDVDCKVGADYV
jgi:hypothetical protein